MAKESYFATCARGLEGVTALELETLGAHSIESGQGGVSFQGDLKLLYSANLWLRTAIRVLCPILRFEIESADELYDVVRNFDWSRYLTPQHTLAVTANVRSSVLSHSRYAALRVKDAICDQFSERTGRRPNVDVENPLVSLNLHVDHNLAVLSLDSSGESLHKRGYRPIQTKAPINEALAAGIIRLCAWDGVTPLHDPLCGSGTFPIEAAWIALRRPPGLTRRRFGFQGWMNYEVELWTWLRDQARREMANKLEASIGGSDLRTDAIRLAQQNARAAGVGHLLHFKECKLEDLQLPVDRPGLIICNPPYGERLGSEADLHPLYEKLGQQMRERWRGWKLCVFTGNERLARAIGLPIEQQFRLYNGALSCKLLQFAPV